MKALLDPLKEIKEYEDLEAEIQQKTGVFQVFGCIDSQKPHLIYGIGKEAGKMIITFSEQRARELYQELRFYYKNVVYYPAKDILFYQSDIQGNHLASQRMMAVQEILTNPKAVVVTTFDALMDRLVPVEILKKGMLHISFVNTLDLEQTKKKLIQMGYLLNHQTEAPGQFAVRGGILDIFPLTEELPIRIEMWGDEINSIRSFEPESQRSVENLEEVTIYPACEIVLEDSILEKGMEKIKKERNQIYDTLRKNMKTEEAYRLKTTTEALLEQLETLKSFVNIEGYLPYFFEKTVSLPEYFSRENLLIFLEEPTRCLEKGRATLAEFSESMKHRLEKGYILPGQVESIFSQEQVLSLLQESRTISLSTLDLKTDVLKIRKHFFLGAKTVQPCNNSFEQLLKDLKSYKKAKYKIILLSGSRTRAARLAKDLQQEGLSCFYTEDYDHQVHPGEIMVLYGKVKRGFEYPQVKFVVISESDIFGEERKKQKRRKLYQGEKIQSFAQLSVGDYVVHESHGVGIYRGIEKIQVDKIMKDYIKIEYAKGENLYIPPTQLETIQKYASSDAKKPKLHRLGGQEWHRTKTKVRGAVKEMAGELVRLYAARQRKQGFTYGTDTVWQQEFEEMFPFEETEDQVLAIEATKRDMESNKIMDRLICGDVGYGKTEIAIRAAFKAVQESKQVVYLVPTTILAQQHYNNFVQRMKDFPVKVDLMCRFCSTSQIKKTIQDLKKGQTDIVIGTHRVLSKDVEFKDLGLLIIDEEQRFGVAHKEKIKQIKNNVDVLTLTATPIPRTLHMSLIGIRDMSILEEPPMDRIPIQTYVMEYDEEVIREAISRELSRQGQVYYVYNRVDDIADMTLRISSLIPEATVTYAHGQMKEKELETIMYDFINGEIQVLVTTTIVETGLDIANVNTMIIHDADRLGLSQLYQLRGRVGRSNRTAYAFLLYRRDKLLTEVAEKRLSAIKEFTALGSGYKIAMRDLEIRGAGNLLGASQHGHMEAVGYDLYCKMLNEAVKSYQGEQVTESFETSIDMEIDAYIPPVYISNEFQKLDIYKRISQIETEEESDDMLEELTDRFGEPPKAVENLLLIARLKAVAHERYFTEIVQKGLAIRFVLYEKAPIDFQKIAPFLEEFYGVLTFKADAKNPFFTFTMNKNSRSSTTPPIEVVKCVLEKAKGLFVE